ncbi:IS701 family transposase [Desulfobotulus mexicanus]|uniref:Transposase n=2 Tax=Desulfobotulus mexicanus TaxID=2586642 RepID=A0A5Q4VI67_9BACT|nr:transposase [Desulfobotulus mexicanus]TYT73963.1 transposase [Desulfobotulus mexicanus]TYT75952.1 transposase [Desulfobotulus mexicanus]
MNPPKFSEYDYMAFLTASPKIFTCTEVERVLQEQKNAPAHDSINRLLHRLTPSASALRNEAIQHVILKKGVLVLDDSTLDKLYAQHIELVSRHWSGKHHAVVKGINLITLLWTDGDRIIPCDYRIYNKEQDGKTKNDHFSDMLLKAKNQGFEPSYVLFDSWYSGLENLKVIRKYGWYWLTRLKSNRLVNPDGKTNVPVSSVHATETGKVVHLKGFGFIKLFGITGKDGTIEYWATNHLDMDDLKRLQLSEFSWKIEEYHRNLKQFCGVERSHVRAAKAQRNHIGLAIRTFLRFSVFSFKTGLSCFELKYRIIRDAVRKYMEHPAWTFEATA